MIMCAISRLSIPGRHRRLDQISETVILGHCGWHVDEHDFFLTDKDRKLEIVIRFQIPQLLTQRGRGTSKLTRREVKKMSVSGGLSETGVVRQIHQSVPFVTRSEHQRRVSSRSGGAWWEAW